MERFSSCETGHIILWLSAAVRTYLRPMLSLMAVRDEMIFFNSEGYPTGVVRYELGDTQEHLD